MKTIIKTGKLQLNKETLRSLSNEQLESVAGASRVGCVPTLLCPTDFCTTTLPTTGANSTPQLGCTGTIVNTSIRTINPGNG